MEQYHRFKLSDFRKESFGISILIVGGGINGIGLFRELALQV
jgi:glycerol-3-phosphate dehydrogenase